MLAWQSVWYSKDLVLSASNSR